MKVSIVLPTFNFKEVLIKSINMLLINTPPIFNLIIVDDGPDYVDTRKYLRILEEDKQITVLYNDKNIGFDKTVNVGLKEVLNNTNSEYIVIFGHDIFVYTGWLEYLIKCIEGDSSIGMVIPKILQHPTNLIQQAGSLINPDTLEVWHRGSGEHRDHPEYNYEREIDWCSFSGNLIRRSVIEEVGLLDESFERGFCEDVDYCFRVRKKGYKIIYCPKSVIAHIGYLGYIKFPKEEVDAFRKRNKEKLKKKWLGKIDTVGE